MRPDLFVIVRDAVGAVVFRSGVIVNVPFLDADPVTGSLRTTVDLVFYGE